MPTPQSAWADGEEPPKQQHRLDTKNFSVPTSTSPKDMLSNRNQAVAAASDAKKKTNQGFQVFPLQLS
jgi:hypothetical protein